MIRKQYIYIMVMRMMVMIIRIIVVIIIIIFIMVMIIVIVIIIIIIIVIMIIIIITLLLSLLLLSSLLLSPGGGTPYVMGDTYVPRFWPPFFTLAGSSTIFLGYFSHPPTAKLSFGVQKLPIFTKIDLFGPKFNFFLDLFGSNFQRPAAHPHQFSDRVPPPGLSSLLPLLWSLSLLISLNL